MHWNHLGEKKLNTVKCSTVKGLCLVSATELVKGLLGAATYVYGTQTPGPTPLSSSNNLLQLLVVQYGCSNANCHRHIPAARKERKREAQPSL